MPTDLSGALVIAVSSRALFNLEEENRIFREEGLDAYAKYQLENEDTILKPGAGFPLVRGILNLNSKVESKRTTEVVIMSRNSSETSLRIWNSISHYGLEISRGAFSGGASISCYLSAFQVDLFLSFNRDDVREALAAKVAAAQLFHHPENLEAPVEQIRVAFDGDAVIFSGESERIYKEQGLEAFLIHEKANARLPLPDGPFAKLLRMLHFVQKQYLSRGEVSPIRTALVTARNAPSHERVIRTLRTWGISIDETFFLGGVPKLDVLRAFAPHIFLDDQLVHCEPAAVEIPTGHVASNDYEEGEQTREGA